MSELLDNQVDTQNENLNSGFHASPHKVCDENKELEKTSGIIGIQISTASL